MLFGIQAGQTVVLSRIAREHRGHDTLRQEHLRAGGREASELRAPQGGGGHRLRRRVLRHVVARAGRQALGARGACQARVEADVRGRLASLFSQWG